MQDLNFIVALLVRLAAKTAKLDADLERSAVLSIFAMLDGKTEFNDKDTIVASEIFKGVLDLQEHRNNCIPHDKNVSVETPEIIEETKKH